jgi:methylenetetrahydrofolate dehydrogenase (NADP+)/methenyltetrahydrofolate cyclohydrolase
MAVVESNPKIIDGRKVSKQLKKELKKQVKSLNEQGIFPKLTVIQVGNDPASEIYVRNKEKACKKIGIQSNTLHFKSISESRLITEIEKLNSDQSVDGILVQLPLPDSVSETKIINSIAPHKDVDGFHPVNLGKLITGEKDGFVPCTAEGIMELLYAYNADCSGKHAVVIGRSKIVGKPISLLLLNKHATVTICHSRTHNLPRIVREADILIAATGQGEMVKSEWLKPGSIVIDVGITRKQDGTICGDVEFENALEKVSLITPVPGGVGPMTVAMLMRNTVKAALLKQGLAS